MSIYGALFAGVAGLNAQSNELGVISDNIANVNTVGYKESSATFSTLVVGNNSGGAYSPGGVLGSSSAQVSTQGLLTTTSSPTDIAISGSGFFVVNQNADQTGQVQYTRAGSFTQDAQGNFVNSAGLFLQAWPLDSSGNLPGTPGNTDTQSSANLSSLQTVNVENVTGTASPTTTVALGANLNSGQADFLGAGGTATPDVSDPANAGISASSIIAPTGVDSLERGDTFNISTGVGQTYTYTYGGFSIGRNVVTGAATGSDADTTLPTTVTLNNTALTPTAVVATTSGAATIEVTVPNTADLIDGDSYTMSGVAAFDNFTTDDLNGTFAIHVIDSTHFSYTANGTDTASGNNVSSSNALGTATPQPIVTNGTTTVTVTQPTAGLAMGDVVTLSGLTSSGGADYNGVPLTDLNTPVIITSIVDANHFTFTLAAAASGSTDSATSDTESGTITSSIRPFAGNILDADNETQTFLGVTGTTPFLPAALSFTINTATTGTVTFTYTPTAPNASLGQFNNLDNLATAINDVTGLTARVATVGSAVQLFVGAANANEGVTFGNGASQGSAAGGSVLQGINWVNELGLKSYSAPAASVHVYNSLNSLSTLVDADPGLTSTVTDPSNASSLAINLTDPLTTIQFADGTYSGTPGTANYGSPLAALGLLPSLASIVPTAGPGATTTIAGPSYNPLNSATNMASGAVTPQFSRPITVLDSLGASHNLTVGFLKTDTNTWQVEIYAQPATDITAVGGHPAGQIADGTIVFNGNGSIQSISSGLTGALPVTWTNGAEASTITYNFGTNGETNGLSQFDSAYNVNFANANGAPVGQLTGVSIDNNGFIIASYSNGQTQKLYQIPLASFSDPNALLSSTGDSFSQTNASGVVNLKQAGSSGVGTITPDALEASNVELSSQLTNMIVAQRSYEANTKIIQTADTLLNDLDQIIQ